MATRLTTRKKCAEGCTCGRHSRRTTPEGRERMRAGGRARALAINASLTPEQRKESARKAARARERTNYSEANADRAKAERERRGDACERCGTGGDLHWHHRDPELRRFGIGNGRTAAVSGLAMLEELAKCDLLCPPCHRVADALAVLGRALKLEPRWRADVALLLDAHPA